MSYSNQYTPTPQRSAIPKVMGILMIIFGSLAILIGLVGLATGGDKQFAHLEEWRTFEKVTQTLGMIGFPISILGFVTGILAVSYKRIAPTLALVYGVVGLIHTLLNAFVVHKYMRAAMDAAVRDLGGHMDSAVSGMMGVGVVLGAIIGLSWSVLVMILMTRPGAKASCIN